MDSHSSRAALERKARSLARLQREGVPTIDHLPTVEDERQAKLRSVDAVVDRAIALLAVGGVGIHAPEPVMRRFMDEFRVAAKLTPDERAFIAEPTDRARVQLSWRYEGLHVLLWALGFVPALARPERQVDPALVGRALLDRGEAKLRAQSRLRSATEILDETDLIYRYHWAVREARLNGEPSCAGLDPGVVRERHYALNWLVGYFDRDWDDVSTDT